MLAGPSQQDTVWCADKACCVIEPHEEAWYVYHTLSGETHLLNFLSYEVLKLLFDTPLDAEAIAEHVRIGLDFDIEDCPLSLIRQTIQELDIAGFIRPSDKVKFSNA